ncbi:MAG: DNA translocase FtsK 4TM domain-containing protein, partial [Pseudomonadota bacterium]
MPSSARSYARSGARHHRDPFSELIERLQSFGRSVLMRAGGAAMALLAVWLLAALATFSISDPSLNTATPAPVENMAGPIGAIAADLLLQLIGGASFLLIFPLGIWGVMALIKGAPEETPQEFWRRLIAAPLALLTGAAFLASWPAPADWPFTVGTGGLA